MDVTMLLRRTEFLTVLISGFTTLHRPCGKQSANSMRCVAMKFPE